MEDNNLYYRQYFKLFKESAPKAMIEWGGYSSGLPTPMASSYESCMCFYNYIQDKKCSLLDAGAGASTWMFRKLLQNVFTVDSEKDYLQVVKNIVGGDNYIVGIENSPVCDYVYWDYGSLERLPLMPIGFSKCKKAMYVDDCHDKGVMDYTIQFAKDNNCKIIQTNSMDEYGRYGVILERQNS
jgi:hypothetical protein